MSLNGNAFTDDDLAVFSVRSSNALLSFLKERLTTTVGTIAATTSLSNLNPFGAKLLGLAVTACKHRRPEASAGVHEGTRREAGASGPGHCSAGWRGLHS